MKPIYLDYHATTPVDARVLESMLPYFSERFGNAASRSHSYGWQASEAVELARSQVADLIHVQAKSIFFTSGATEGLNMLIKGIAQNSKKGKHIITCATEHHAVLDVTHWLKEQGFEITIVPVDRNGSINVDLLKVSIRPDTILVTLMWANNETGVIHDIDLIGAICRDANVSLISDATQAVGKMDIDPVTAQMDAVACSAHKFYGPKGIGAVWINPSLKTKPLPLIHGGGHENGFRSGTMNVPAIVGMGMAAKICKEEMQQDHAHISNLRDQFEKKVLAAIDQSFVNGNQNSRLHTVSNIGVPFTESQAVMTKFRSKLAISSGSACSSADPTPSHVLLAMGLSGQQAKASYRFSFGRFTTSEEMESAAELFIKASLEYRSQNPVWQMHLQGIDVSDASH